MNNKRYVIGEIFQISGSTSVNKTDIGDGSKNLTPYICRGKENSGYSGSFYHTPNQKANCIIVGSQGATAFYQHRDFFTGTGVIVIRHDKMNENNGLYISTALNKSLSMYGGRFYEVSQGSLRLLEISLPSVIRNDGTFEPDWDYMEKVIANLRKQEDSKIEKEIATIERIKAVRGKILDSNMWKEFRNLDLFENVVIKKIRKPEFISRFKNNKYKYPVLNQSSVNNQVEGYIDNSSTKGNVITIDSLSTGLAFYQPENFSSIEGRHNLAIKLKNTPLNENLALFLVTLLNKNLSKKNYSDQRSQKKFFLESIRIPVNSNGDPDWKQMEEYVEKIKKGGREIK